MLLHLTTPASWRVGLAAGSMVTPSLLTDGFIHLSPPDQVRFPADRLFAGRDDVILLAIDPVRLTDEVRWEPVDEPDLREATVGGHTGGGAPRAMRFPHLYGPLPVAAVTSVLPYRPGPDGHYTEPAVPDASDRPGRARAFDRSLALRRSPTVFRTATGWVALDPRVSASYEHNCLWVDGGDVAVDEWVADAEGALGGCAHRRVVLDHEPASLPPGWQLEEERLLVLGPDVAVPRASGVDVRPVTGEVMAGLWGPSWRRAIADITEEAVDDLLRREAFADAHLRVVDLAVVGDDGVPRSSAQLRIDGATAAIEAVQTEPGARGQGWGTAVVGEAIARARAAGCDLVWLLARADDWPRHWYERLGFVDVGARWVASRT